MSQKFKLTRRVEFRDTDMAGIVHFSNFFIYMEQTEHEFLRSVGLGVICEVDGQKISWPRVNAQCDYKRAIRFEELIDIEVTVKRIGTKSSTYGFEFIRDQELVAQGEITAVCCLIAHGELPKPVIIPEGFLTAVRPYAS